MALLLLFGAALDLVQKQWGWGDSFLSYQANFADNLLYWFLAMAAAVVVNGIWVATIGGVISGNASLQRSNGGGGLEVRNSSQSP